MYLKESEYLRNRQTYWLLFIKLVEALYPPLPLITGQVKNPLTMEEMQETRV